MQIVERSPYAVMRKEPMYVQCDFCKAKLVGTPNDVTIKYEAGYSDMRESWPESYSCSVLCLDCGRTIRVEFEDKDFVAYLYATKGENCGKHYSEH